MAKVRSVVDRHPVSPLLYVTLLAVVIGAIIYYIVIQVVLAMGMNPNYLKLLSALVVAVFLSLPYWKGRYFAKAVKRGGAANA